MLNVGGATAALNFNGGILQVTGAVLTSLGNHVINSASFTGGFDIAAGNSFTVSQAIGGTGSLSKPRRW